MLFFTVVFITYYLASIVKGNLFFDVYRKIAELTIKQNETEDKKEKDNIAKEILKTSWSMLVGFGLLIVEIIYIFSALSIDIYKYPTIITLFYIVLMGFVFNKNNKKPKVDLKTEEGRIRYKIELEKVKRYSFKGIMSNLIYLVYFGYMFYLLILR
jgi:hypothetical protein